jgi:hypothetical protein
LIVNAVFAICNISGMYSKRPVQTAKWQRRGSRVFWTTWASFDRNDHRAFPNHKPRNSKKSWCGVKSSQVTNHQECTLHCAKSNSTVKNNTPLFPRLLSY